MTELRTFRCNRCSKVFTVPITEAPAELVLTQARTIDHRVMGNPSENEIIRDTLCEDCYYLIITVIAEEKPFTEFYLKYMSEKKDE